MCGHDDYPTENEMKKEDEDIFCWSLSDTATFSLNLIAAGKENPDPAMQQAVHYARSVLANLQAQQDMISTLANCVRCTELHLFDVECSACGWIEKIPNASVETIH